jgi:hypothetical protein
MSLLAHPVAAVPVDPDEPSDEYVKSLVDSLWSPAASTGLPVSGLPPVQEAAEMTEDDEPINAGPLFEDEVSHAGRTGDGDPSPPAGPQGSNSTFRWPGLEAAWTSLTNLGLPSIADLGSWILSSLAGLSRVASLILDLLELLVQTVLWLRAATFIAQFLALCAFVGLVLIITTAYVWSSASAGFRLFWNTAFNIVWALLVALKVLGGIIRSGGPGLWLPIVAIALELPTPGWSWTRWLEASGWADRIRGVARAGLVYKAFMIVWFPSATRTSLLQSAKDHWAGWLNLFASRKKTGIERIPLPRDLTTMCGGHGKVKNLDDRPVPANILDKIIPRILAKGRQDQVLHYVGPLVTEKIRRGESPWVPLPDDRITLLIFFCGPLDTGHYFPGFYNPNNNTMVVFCNAFKALGGMAVLDWWANELGCSLIVRDPLTATPFGCALNVVLLAARVSKISIAGLTKRSILNWETSELPMVHDPTLPCFWCGSNSCKPQSCPGPRRDKFKDVEFLRAPSPNQRRQPSFPWMVMAVLAALLSAGLAATAYLATGDAVSRSSWGSRIDPAASAAAGGSATPGSGGSVFDRVLSYVDWSAMAGGNVPLPPGPHLGRDSPVISQAQTLTLLKEEAAKVGGPGNDLSKLRGKVACLVMRSRLDGGTLTNWCGHVSGTVGTSTRATGITVKCEYEEGFLKYVPDDAESLLSEDLHLPFNAAEAETYDLLHVQFMDAVPERKFSQQQMVDSDSSDDANVLEGAPRGVDGPDSPQQVSRYPRVPDEVYAADEALWSPDAVGDFNPTAAITGTEFLRWSILSAEDAQKRAPPLPWASVTSPTRAAHVRVLQAFHDYLQKSKNGTMPLDFHLAVFLSNEKIAKKWSWHTTARNTSALFGALMQLPLYVKEVSAVSLNPTRWPYVKAMCQATFRLGAMSGHRIPIAIPYSDMLKAAKLAPNATTRAHIYLSWFACLRPSDTLQLKGKNIAILDNGEMSILVQYCKTVRVIGSYWVHTNIVNEEVRNFLREWISQQRKGEYLIKVTSPGHHRALIKAGSDTLRKVNPKYEWRGIRKGMLQAMSKAGASVQAMLSMSRHTSEKALYGYLSHVPSPEQLDAVAAVARMEGIERDKRDIADDELLRNMAGAGVSYVQILPWLKIGTDGSMLAMLGRMPKDSKERRPRAVMKEWPLHVKNLSSDRVDIAKVTELTQREGASPNVAANWAHAVAYLNDANGLFGAVPWDGRIEKGDFTKEDVAILTRRGNLAKLTRREWKLIRGTVKFFWVGEERTTDAGEDDSRRRVITHTESFNNYYSKAECLWNAHSTSRLKARRQVFGGTAALTLDASAQFDQLPVGRSVSFAQVIRLGRHLFRRTTASMGCRPSSDAGTSLTDVLADFPTPCEVAIATDAVRFIGSFDDVLAAGWELVQRAKFCRVKFNGIDVQNATIEDVRKLVVTSEVDFLGERLNLAEKTVCCKPKHVVRLVSAATRAVQPAATYRDFLVLFGILNYMSEVLAVRKDRHFEARLFYSNMARSLARDPSLLDKPAGVVFPDDLRAWVGLVALNQPVKVRIAAPCSAGIVFDASASGAAGIITLPDGSSELWQHRWTHRERDTINVHHSAQSESAAAELLARFASSKWPGLVFMMLSDHNGLVLAFKHRNVCTRAYNSAISAILDADEDNRLRHIPGTHNPADVYSRMKAEKLTTKHALEARALVTQAIAEQVAYEGLDPAEVTVLVAPDSGDTDPTF